MCKPALAPQGSPDSSGINFDLLEWIAGLSLKILRYYIIFIK
jgi:hypothetical protein